ncbi:restriction endonuclease subunit S [Xanthomonas campestris pv. incanae]|uniref:restriction endonuclease subunit S n=1 Tax=Xanthomonas campestris TaxID=339 RepID=UPI0029C18E33|nr:restriction endonuclease subunit S [Xanthomonas campestris]MDX6081673.1 restriction endonuclease subunit S [Xanthomonas campestris pv. incanae]MDX6085100.1 restriction endonuclease subunit S [Xanthomonas campestris pv. incanae]MDX6139581.1 restriction endonuclease subunit S [Xanthomonas campestris pv. incanae]
MLPDGWRLTTLGDIGSVKSGSTPARSQHDRYFVGGKWPWVKTMDLTNSEILTTDEVITDAALAESSCRLFPAGTVLVAMYGGFKQIGRTGLLREKSAVNQAISAIDIERNQADPEFVLHWLNGSVETWRNYAASSRKDPNITRENVCDFPVILPTLGEQRRIAHILSTWDQAIATTERLLANACTQRKTLTNALFVHGRHSSMTTHGWKFADLDEVFERVTRRNTTANSNVLTISGTRGLVSQRDYFNKSVASENLSGYTLIERGEFAYNKSYSAGYPMGAIKPLTRYDQGVVSSLYICFRLRDGVEADADFFRHYFEVGMLNEGLSGIAQEGARNHGLLNVGVGDFFKLRLHIPDVTEQRRVAAILNMAEQKEQLITAQLDKLRDEKKALMSQLLTGKRRVRLPADEAAHA